ncbi:hypothetical protein BOX15_Mlig000014g6, partial [Macrostomum lignano]
SRQEHQQQQDSSIADKLRVLFNKKPSSTSSEPQQLLQQLQQQPVLTEQLVESLSCGQDVELRIKAVQQLAELVSNRRLETESGGLERIWLAVRDLVDAGQTNNFDARSAVWRLVTALAGAYYPCLGYGRAAMFQALQTDTGLPEVDSNPAELCDRIEALRVLTRSGIDLNLMEEEAGPLLCRWLARTGGSTSACNALFPLLLSIVEHNAGHLDHEHVRDMALTVWSLTQSGSNVSQCGQHYVALLRKLVQHHSLPMECLMATLRALCLMATNSALSVKSWDVVHSLLCSHLGQATLLVLCALLESPDSSIEIARGSVACLSLALWGERGQRVDQLCPNYTSVLLCLLRALNRQSAAAASDSPVARQLAFDILASVARLLEAMTTVAGLRSLCWTVLLDLLDKCLFDFDVGGNAGDKEKVCLAIEQLLGFGQVQQKQRLFTGSAADLDRLHELLLNCLPVRPAQTAAAGLCQSAWARRHCLRVAPRLLGDSLRTPVALAGLRLLATAWTDRTAGGDRLPIVSALNSAATAQRIQQPDKQFACSAVELSLGWLTSLINSSQSSGSSEPERCLRSACLVWATQVCQTDSAGSALLSAVRGLSSVFSVSLRHDCLEVAVQVYELLAGQISQLPQQQQSRDIRLALVDFIVSFRLDDRTGSKLVPSRRICLLLLEDKKQQIQQDFVYLPLTKATCLLASLLSTERNLSVLRALLDGICALAPHRNLLPLEEAAIPLIVSLSKFLLSQQQQPAPILISALTAARSLAPYLFDCPVELQNQLAAAVCQILSNLQSRRHPQESGLAASALAALTQLLIETPGAVRPVLPQLAHLLFAMQRGSPTDWQLAEHPEADDAAATSNDQPPVSLTALHFLSFLCRQPDLLVSLSPVEYRCLTSSALAGCHPGRCSCYGVQLAHDLVLRLLLALPMGQQRINESEFIVSTLSNMFGGQQQQQQQQQQLLQKQQSSKLSLNVTSQHRLRLNDSRQSSVATVARQLSNEDSSDRPRGGSLNERAMSSNLDSLSLECDGLVSGLLRSGPDQRASDSRPGIHSLLRLGNVAAFDTRDFNRDLAAVTCDLAEHFSVLPLDLDETELLKATDSGAPQSPTSAAEAAVVFRAASSAPESENKDHQQQTTKTQHRWLIGSSLICVAPTSFAGRSEVRIHRVAGVTSAAVKLSAAAESDVDDSAAAVAAFHAMYRGLSPAGLNNIAPLRLRDDSELLRLSCDRLDHLRVPQVHSIGLVYADQHQSAESEFFSNQAGSPRYAAFLRRLATPRDLLRDDGAGTGGWDAEDDGRWLWQLRLGLKSAVFHAVTAMRPAESGRGREGINRKKRLVGNDLTAVIYQEAGSRYGVESIATQCLFSHLVIQPLPNGLNRVRLVVKDVPGLADSFSDWRLCLVSDNALPLVASQLALLTDLAAQVATGAPRDAANPGGNVYLARLLQLRRVWSLADREAGIGCLAE